MKHLLCEAFCDLLEIQEVPAGFAVSTGFRSVTGEPLLFYIIGPSKGGNNWYLQDDGTTIPYIEATGADLETGARAELFKSLLTEHDAIYVEETCELRSVDVKFDEMPHAAIKFMGLLMRVQEFLQVTRERVEALWIEEAFRDLQAAVGQSAILEKNAFVAPELEDWPADVVVRAENRTPVALFFGTSDAKAYQAMLLHSTARYQLGVPCLVVLLLEDDAGLTAKVRQKADNSIIVPRYRGAERQAVGRIAEEALGTRPAIH